MQTTKSILASVFACFAGTVGLTSSAWAGLPLHEDGVYKLNVGGKMATYRVNLKRAVVKAAVDPSTGETLPGEYVPVTGISTKLSSVVSRVKSHEASKKRLVSLEVTRDGDPTLYTLRRKILVFFSGAVDANSVKNRIGATSAYTFNGNGSANAVVFCFEGPADALVGAEAALKVSGVTSAVPLLGSTGMLEKHYVPNDTYYRYRPQNPGYGWHIKNVGVRGGIAGVDINGEVAWNAYRGVGIRMSVVDDGLEINHVDLKNNTLGYSGYNFLTDVADPTGGEHGTCVGGLMGAVGDNNAGVVGVAFKGKLIGLKILLGENDTSELGQDVTEEEIATALNYSSLVSVCNNSWGYTRAFSPPAPLDAVLQLAIMGGATKGRGGRGTLMVFSAGNGRGDTPPRDTNDSPLTNYYWSLPVAATLDDALIAAYSTPGAGIVAGAPSGALLNQPWEMITTTDRTGKSLGYNSLYKPANPGANFSNFSYTNTFNGTSAAAPILSGALALVVEARPILATRDVWDIIARTARPFTTNPFAFQTRTTEGVVYHTNHDTGHGMIDVGAATTMAKTWKNLLSDYNKDYTLVDPYTVPGGSTVTKSFRVFNGPRMRTEKVAVTLTVEGPNPALLSIDLSSSKQLINRVPPLPPPAPRITSNLQVANARKTSPNTWTYTTVQHWAECSGGDWQLKIRNTSGTAARITSATLTIHGGPGTKPVIAPIVADDGLPMPEGVEYCRAYPGFQIVADGCPLSYGASGLPQGLHCDPITGYISGTPYESGNFTVSMWATNEIGTTTITKTLLIEPRISVPHVRGGYLGVATVGQPFRIMFEETYPTQMVPEGTLMPVTTDPMTVAPFVPGVQPTKYTTFWRVNTIDDNPGFEYWSIGGMFEGIPQNSGVFHFNVNARNYCGSDTQEIIIIVQPEGYSIATGMDVPGQIFNQNWADDWATVTFDPTSADTWMRGSDHFLFGGDSAVSPIFAGRRIAEMNTVIVGPVRLEFDWMTNNHPDDHLNFYIDGVLSATISGNSGWQHFTSDIAAAGNHTIKWQYDNASAELAGEDRGHVDHLQLIYPALGPAIGWTASPVTSFGAAPWVVDGSSATSGAIAENQQSSMAIEVTGPGVLKFDWVVSSAAVEDTLSFYLDDAAVAGVDPISGILDPVATITVPIPAGTHVVRWTYATVGDPLAPNTDGADAGTVSNVSFTPTP